MPFVKLTAAEAKHPMKALRKGLMVTTIVSGILFLFATIFLLGNGEFSMTFLYLYFCLLAGLAASVAIDYITDYYTGSDRKPVGRIAKASETGAATNIITGFAVGLETTMLPIVSLVIALIASYWLWNTICNLHGTLLSHVVTNYAIHRRNLRNHTCNNGYARSHGHGLSLRRLWTNRRQRSRHS